MDQNVLLDMLELIAEEKRINETRPFHPGTRSRRPGSRRPPAGMPPRSPTSRGNWHGKAAAGDACPPASAGSTPTSTACSTPASKPASRTRPGTRPPTTPCTHDLRTDGRRETQISSTSESGRSGLCSCPGSGSSQSRTGRYGRRPHARLRCSAAIPEERFRGSCFRRREAQNACTSAAAVCVSVHASAPFTGTIDERCDEPEIQ